ncbi:HAD hydrolase-like protein [Alteromonadaceae bacterium BrNp21-10]|nr:HAD hydrolase-like protein [Alteromonadaceae bacterium BrNp21-10]
MSMVYLFDWGDTLMEDFPDAKGKMCDWVEVQAIDGALAALSHLSQNHVVYIATGAADSQVADIQKAFSRVGLDQFIDGYFCQQNLGVGKDDERFFPIILKQLQCAPADITMVGDSLERDIKPALKAGMQALWYNPKHLPLADIQQIKSLTELIP